MSSDPRCCGTGTCIINADGVCWCGQKWDGEKMCFPDIKKEKEDFIHKSTENSDLNESTSIVKVTE